MKTWLSGCSTVLTARRGTLFWRTCRSVRTIPTWRRLLLRALCRSARHCSQAIQRSRFHFLRSLLPGLRFDKSGFAALAAGMEPLAFDMSILDLTAVLSLASLPACDRQRFCTQEL